MSIDEVKLLLDEGEHQARIIDLEPSETRTTGRSLIKIHLDIKGHHLVCYQVCGVSLRNLVLSLKDQYIGKTIKAKVEHVQWSSDTMFHQAVSIEEIPTL